MNILFLSEVSAVQIIGGAERVLSEQARGLRQRGHHVSIVARAPLTDPRPEATLGDVPEHRYMPVRAYPLGFVVSSVVGSLRAMRRAQLDHPWSVLIIHQALAGFGALLHRPRVPAVYVCHSLAHEEYLSRNPVGPEVTAGLRRRLHAGLRRRIEGAVLRRCQRVIVLSEFMRQRVLAVHRLSEARVCVIPGGTDPGQFRPAADRPAVRQRLGLPERSPVLLTVRNLVPRMGLDRLIHAMSLLRAWRSDVRLIIGGEGPLRARLDSMIRELGLEAQVQLAGFVAEKELPSYYQAADLVVMPTLELEGFGLVTIEALACGTPVLGTPVGAIPEVLRQLDSGLLTAGTGAEALAAGIRRFLERVEAEIGAAESLARSCRRLIEARYSWAHHLGALEGVLKEIQ